MAFEAGPWGNKYPAITMRWQRNWTRIMSFFSFFTFSTEVRKLIYTINAIESLLKP
jgi:putative transposase